MMSELYVGMKAAASAAQFPAEPTAVAVWGISLSEILKVVMAKAVELGREYRPEIQTAGRSAVDALVELDIPGIPSVIEGAIDSATREAGYTAITAILDALLGLQAG